MTKDKMISAIRTPVRNLRRHALALSSWTLGFGLWALSFSPVHAEPLTIQLVSEVTSVQPGIPFHAGLHLKHAEHYHTYWKFPGIVGVPTDMAWTLPPGWKAEAIEWPAPERVMMFQIKAQGFHGEVLLPMKLTPPKNLELGTKVTLGGKATWMCCGRECNPGFADLSLTLPVGEEAGVKDPRWEKLFKKARSTVAKLLQGFAATATREADRVTLRLTSKHSATAATTPSGIFFTEDGYINADKEQVFRKEGDSLVIELVVSSYYTEKPPKTLRGVLWLKDGSLGHGALIDVPLSRS